MSKPSKQTTLDAIPDTPDAADVAAQEQPATLVASVLTDNTKDVIREALHNIADQPGFRDRPAQRLMIAEVAKTLSGEYDGQRIICVEGPTGTGKSLGYMLPAIPVAKARRKTLIIATATVALQEQLVTKDLPALQEISGLEFDWALAKGRRRYVCDRNLERYGETNPDQDSLDLQGGQGNEEDQAIADAMAGDGWSRPPTSDDLNNLRAMIKARDEHRWSGDLDEWPRGLSPLLREHVTTDQSGCTNHHCAKRYSCPFFQARDKLKSADVVVANHALVMSDLMLGGGVLLPAPEDCIYVFDEGHHLPAVAIDQGATQATVGGPKSWLKGLLDLHGKALKFAKDDDLDALTGMTRRLNTSTVEVTERLDDIAQALRAAHPWCQTSPAQRKKMPGFKKRALATWRFPRGEVPAELIPLFAELYKAAQPVLGDALKISQTLRSMIKDRPEHPALSRLLSTCNWTNNRLNTLVECANQMRVPPGNSASPPQARWIDYLEDKDDFLCSTSPTSAAQMLQDLLWSECDGAVVTSATLAALGRFDRFYEQSGLSPQMGVQGIRLASPFDYANKGQLVIPAMASSAKDHDAHTAEIIRMLDNGLVKFDEGSLVLFASYRQMKQVAEGVNDLLGSLILMQGSGPRYELLDKHRKRIIAGKGSVLFGVSSFSEGIDLPGKQCTHVVVAKLPFSMPDSPVEATYAEWLKSRGRNPFMEMSVPDAGFRLVQSLGRLLRTEEDSGKVTILDRRLVQTPYGQQMLAAFPPFARVIEDKDATKR